MFSSLEQCCLMEWNKLKLIGHSCYYPKPTPVYPSEYFEKNNKQKPSVSLSYKDVDLDTLRPVVVKSIKDGKISHDIAALFLWKFGERFKATLTDKWESFGVTIAEPGEVKLSSIIGIHFGTKDIPSSDEKDGIVSSNDDNWIASFLTSIYRINIAKNEKYRTELSKAALNVLIKNFGKVSISSSDFTNVNYQYWINNDIYCKIIAAYDMFLHKTKLKKYQFIRWGTLSARYRECSVLSSWIDISKEFGYKNTTDFRQLVLYKTIDEDLDRILKDGEEIDKPDSYMPYLYDLRITRSSPYTCTNNPALHAFLSTTKVYMGQKAPVNTKMLYESIHRYTACFNGLILAYLLHEKNCAAKKSTENSGDPIGTKDIQSQLIDYMKHKGAVIRGPLEEFKKSIDSTIVNPDQRTIGYYLTVSFK